MTLIERRFRCGVLTATVSIKRKYDGLNSRVLFSRGVAVLVREKGCIVSWVLSTKTLPKVLLD